MITLKHDLRYVFPGGVIYIYFEQAKPGKIVEIGNGPATKLPMMSLFLPADFLITLVYLVTMTLGRLPLNIFCSCGTPPPESIVLFLPAAFR